MNQNNELYHHGIKGQRWGVRRYQNYDGSYTQAGMKRYNSALEKYNKKSEIANEVKNRYKSGNASKEEYRLARANAKQSKKELNKHYKHLRQDKLADQGKILYREGRRITYDAQTAAAVQTGASIASYVLYNSGKQKAAIALASSATAVNLGLTAVNNYNARRLRAYYTHTSNY